MPPTPGITDAALLAFARWCRVNRPETVTDLNILRPVFDAYSTLGTDGDDV